jgi:septal ring factor EnvC (AmiA/AmiB activator)
VVVSPEETGSHPHFAFNTKYMIPEIQKKIADLQGHLVELQRSKDDLARDLADLRQQLQVERPPSVEEKNPMEIQRDYDRAQAREQGKGQVRY